MDKTTSQDHKSCHGKSRRARSRSRSPLMRCPSPPIVKEEDKAKVETSKPENVGLGAKNRLKSLSYQMKMGQKKEPSKQPKMTVAQAFNQDSDEEPEEIPPEAKMRMRNIGRDTPTSSGPNSFGKTKQGFSDAKKLFEKTMKDAMDSALADD